MTTIPRRSVRETFNLRARSLHFPEGERGDRLHCFSDCVQITGNHCEAEPDLGDDERPLCWTCVGRIIEMAGVR